MYALVLTYKVQCSFEERQVLSRAFWKNPTVQKPLPLLCTWHMDTAHMHALIYVVTTYVHVECGTLSLISLAHIATVTKIKPLATYIIYIAGCRFWLQFLRKVSTGEVDGWGLSIRPYGAGSSKFSILGTSTPPWEAASNPGSCCTILIWARIWSMCLLYSTLLPSGDNLWKRVCKSRPINNLAGVTPMVVWSVV